MIQKQFENNVYLLNQKGREFYFQKVDNLKETYQ